jgi:hypothetical protein
VHVNSSFLLMHFDTLHFPLVHGYCHFVQSY